jgi:hypothetical protein
MKLRYRSGPIDLDRIERAHQERVRNTDCIILACCCALQRLSHCDPRIPQYLLDMATHLRQRHMYLGDMADIEQAAYLCRWGLAYEDLHPALHAALLDELGQSEVRLWFSDRNKAHLDNSLLVHLESSTLRKEYHLDGANNAYCLALTKLYLSYMSSNPSAGFHESLELFRRAADATDDIDLQSRCLKSMCEAIVMIYERAGENLLDDAFVAMDKAMSLTPQDDAEYAGRLAALGGLLWKAVLARSTDTPVEDLEAALKAMQEACKIALITSPFVYRATKNNSGWVWLTSFEQTGNLDHLDEATEIARDSLTAGKNISSHLIVSIRRLQFCLRRRYERLGVLGDLDESIELGRRALDASPPGDFERLANLCFLASGLNDCLIPLTMTVALCVSTSFCARKYDENRGVSYSIQSKIAEHDHILLKANILQKSILFIVFFDTIVKCAQVY